MKYLGIPLAVAALVAAFGIGQAYPNTMVFAQEDAQNTQELETQATEIQDTFEERLNTLNSDIETINEHLNDIDDEERQEQFSSLVSVLQNETQNMESQVEALDEVCTQPLLDAMEDNLEFRVGILESFADRSVSAAESVSSSADTPSNQDNE